MAKVDGTELTVLLELDNWARLGILHGAKENERGKIHYV